ncbi:MAG: hypothetical protein HY359_08615 [Candidatus Rokubacteria bacterium]|nr:hypothetical protein [Candidatus Rokubacteria bacterium]
MALLFRILKARPGREVALLDCLQHDASRGVEDEERCLLICRTDDPGQFLWIGHRPNEAQPTPRPKDLVDSLAEPLLLEPAPAVSLRFVGGWHRLPAPAYQIWNVEVRGTDDLAVASLTGLFTPPGGEGADHLIGRSVFRVIEEASVFVGFVALTCGWVRQHPVPRRTRSDDSGAVAVWRPLSTVYQAEAYRGGVEGRPLSSLWAGVTATPTPVPMATSS